MTLTPELRSKFRRFQGIALLVGILAGVVCAWGAYATPSEFYPAYLVGFLFWWGLTLGCLGIVMLHNVTGGAWGSELRQVLEEGMVLFPLVAILFLPIAFGMPELYPWARPEVVKADELLQRKAAYLNVPAFHWRAVGYFVILSILAWMLYRWSTGRHRDRATARRRLILTSGPGLILWALVVTFASVDWVMSLEPHWFSSMYGVLYMGAAGVAGLSFGIIVLVAMRDTAQSSEAQGRLNDLGNLLLAFVLFWSYVSFMQYLIIWSGNLPEESPWYLDRSRGGWQWVAMALIGLHFMVPFLLLLMRNTKRIPSRLVRVVCLLLIMRLIDLFWLVMPAFWPGQLHVHWLNVAAPLAVGGFWLAAFLRRLEARSRVAPASGLALDGAHA